MYRCYLDMLLFSFFLLLKKKNGHHKETACSPVSTDTEASIWYKSCELDCYEAVPPVNGCVSRVSSIA